MLGIQSFERSSMRYDISVCSYRELPERVRRWKPTHLLSMVDTGKFRPPKAVSWARLPCEDIETLTNPRAPTCDVARGILALGDAMPDGGRLLIHCEAGVSRSGAAALMLLAKELGVDAAVDALAVIRPTAYPNKLLVRYADTLLRLDGVLMDALPGIRQRANACFLNFDQDA